MAESDKHILLAKWLEGTLTDEEATALEKTEQLNELKTSLNRLNDYDFPPMEEAALFIKITQNRQPKKAKIRRIIPRWARVAASIVLLLSISLWWWIGQGTLMLANNGEKMEFTLPSSSEVVLNAGSELRFFENKWQTERRMKLQGEAFFNVTKGLPFKVESANGLVEVLGTQFAIFDRGNTFEVFCYEGSVRVTSEKAALQSVLQKGEGVKVEGNNFTTFKEERVEPSWTKGISIFAKTKLSKVFLEIERQYDIKFNFSNVNLQRNFKGEFPHDDLVGALERVCGAMNLKYEINLNDKKVEVRPIE